MKEIYNPYANRAPELEERGDIPAASIPTFQELLGLVGEDILTIPSVYSCVSAITTGIASVPLKVQTKQGDEWQDAKSHYLSQVLQKPNKLYNKNVFIEALVKDALLDKAGYALIERNTKRKVTGLYRVSPSYVNVVPDNQQFPKELFYQIASMQGMPSYDSDNVLVLMNNLSNDGFSGAGIKTYARDTTDLNKTLVSNAKNSFTDGKAQRIVAVKGRGSQTKLENVSKSLASTSNGGTTVLEADSIAITELQRNNKESMLIEARKFSAEEICIFFNIHPSFIGLNAQNAISADALEAIHRQFISITLEPWFDKFELELTKLLSTSESKNTRVVFDRTANLKTSPKNQSEFYSKLVLNGIITPNEAARRLGLPVIEGGDDLLVVGGVTKIKDLDILTAAQTDNKIKGAASKTDEND